RYLNQPQYKFLAGSSPLPFSPDVLSSVPDYNQILQQLRGMAQAGEITALHTTQEIDSHLRAPYIIQSAFTVERQLPKNTTVSVSYVNSHGVHEFRSEDIN